MLTLLTWLKSGQMVAFGAMATLPSQILWSMTVLGRTCTSTVRRLMLSEESHDGTTRLKTTPTPVNHAVMFVDIILRYQIE